MTQAIRTIGQGCYWDDLALGERLRTVGRTITETDLVNFVNLSWLTEELFANAHSREGMAIKGRPVPAALVYACAEGLLTPFMQGTGLAFLNAQLDVKAPTQVNDTIHVECEVIELREASKGHRGHIRTRNQVVNQDGVTVLEYTPLRIMKRRPA
ncbi:acyl dehydratase [Allopusillimonas soli]|uniref:Acyl dehydratase n=1 Tax=Allopusillimonas soli TaxID=659016 RepID=A0A853FCM7_9BURK|nr:acyl dehydratase [Allopusillimonas soli]NYT37833.1 acyl dehydratase [Allopusillimonas soli]TEA73739.1 acyl dehydratase [Allopusillimonas soli]